MNKNLFLCAALTAAAWFTGCNKEDSEPSPEYYFQVHFDANGATNGTAPEDMTMVSGKSYKIPINITKEGCELLGLGHKDPSDPDHLEIAYCNEDGTMCEIKYHPMDYTCKKDTLFAIWDRRTVTITYHANGASGQVPQPISFDLPKYQKPYFSGDVYWHSYYGKNHGKIISLPDTVILDNGEDLKYQEEYYLTGWNTKADGSGVFLPKGTKYVNAEDNVDLYAVFESHNGHEYVDLGLPSGTLWAKTNIGTTCEAETGNLFAYGETKPKDKYTHENWELLDDEWDDMFTIMTDTYKEAVYVNGIDNSEKYEPIWHNLKLMFMQDAASTNWGHLWRIPSEDEWKELFDNCTVEDYDYVLIEEGKTLLSKILRSKINGKYIIIPAYTYFSINHSSGNIYKLENKGYFTKLTLRYDNSQDRQKERPVWYSTGHGNTLKYWDGFCVRPVTSIK
ncbi:MAG: InlB B-repeat-containing protein [Bacteroidales bacterium]|nr:InlB B-repeat-containing protein [Bacteroidales bacterium]